MSKLILVVGAGIVLMFILVSSGTLKLSISNNQNQTAPAKEQTKPTISDSLESEPYINQDMGFSINKPKGWIIKEDKYGVQFFLSQDEQKAKDKGLIMVKVNKLGPELLEVKFSTLVDLQRKDNKAIFAGMEVTGEGPTKQGSIEAYRFEYNIQEKWQDYKGINVIFTQNGKLFRFYGMAEPKSWDELRPAIEDSLKTFKTI